MIETVSGAPSDLHERIAARVRELRAARGYSLDELATRSGVSRSMISLIERERVAPLPSSWTASPPAWG